MDRTNWRLGRRDVNILMIGIVNRAIAIPVCWRVLDKAQFQYQGAASRSLFPYGIRSGVPDPAAGCGVPDDPSVSLRPDFRCRGFAGGFSLLPDRAVPVFPGFPPAEAPAAGPVAGDPAFCPWLCPGACRSRNVRQTAADFV